MSIEVVRFLEECRTGNLTKVKEFIENGVKPDSFCTTDNKSSILPKGASGLCVAALEGHIEIIDFLLNNGADVHFRCQQGETALFLAARNGHDQVVTRLLDAGALLVYTGGPGEKRILEHWEVFTQVLHNVYPKDINKAENAQYKVIAQHLVEHNQMSDRPSILYESMFCSLTVFANPIAVYSVGVYATLCPELASAVFTEENFVRALCRAYDVSRTFDFVHTVHKMVAISKHRQKELCISLVKLFKWGDLLRRLAEDLTRYHTSDAESVVQFQELCDCLFRILDVFSSNLYVRIIILDQFRVLSHEDMARIGRLIKFLLDYNSPSEAEKSNEKSHIWQFLFFLLKIYFRLKQDNHVTRLLLRSTSGSEFEKRVLLKTLEEDATLAHLLLDFGVTVSGECVVKSVEHGHLDLVNRFKNDREILFSKEIEELLKIHPSVKNSSNRNMRRCLKLIKSQRGMFEEERRKFEAELLDDATITRSGSKKKKQKSKNKRNALNIQLEIPEKLENSGENKQNAANIQLDIPEKLKNSSKNRPDSAPNYERESDDTLVFNGEPPKPGKRKRKNKKKNQTKKLNKEESIEDTTQHEPPPPKEETPKHTTSSGWRELVLQESRRRRQSSSSSDCSSGARKSVHFSHPLTFYESTKPRDQPPKVKVKPPPNYSNLKAPKPDPEIDFDTNVEINDFGTNITWRSASNRWAPRFEDLSEMDIDKLRRLTWENDSVLFCDKQKHLNIGAGPDFSLIYLGLMGSGVEVAIKKINSKRASVLSQRDTIASLLSIPQHRNINKYYSILKEKTHFYVIQTVGEYSLEQIYKHKLLTLATTHQDCCMQISHGLDFLHKHGILHMAVKPQNVFVGVDNQIRLGDYGIHMREHQSEGKPLVPSVTNVSTCWLASEVIQNHCDVTTASDIASLGMVMFYVLSGGCHPFGDPNTVPSVCISNIVRGAFNLKMLHDPYPHHLIKSIIQKDADHRLKMDELLAHPYFWSDQRKEEYLEKLVRSALGGWVGPDGEIMDMLAKHEREIINMYNKQEMNEVNNIQELLTMIQGCLRDVQVFENYKKKDISTTSPALYFAQVFPGLLLKTFNLFDLDTLFEPCSKPAEFAGQESGFTSKSVIFPHEEKEVNLKPLGVGMESNSYLSRNGFDKMDQKQPEETTSEVNRSEKQPKNPINKTQQENEQNQPRIETTHQLKINGTTNYTEKDQIPSSDTSIEYQTPTKFITHGYQPNKTNLKNPTLCLGVNDEGLGQKGVSVVDPILGDKDWCHNGELLEDRPEDLEIIQGSSEGHLDVGSKVDERSKVDDGSPDDWIEIGSPLTHDDSPLSTSSGESVDDCFDFGRNYREHSDVGDFAESFPTKEKHVQNQNGVKNEFPLKQPKYQVKSTWTDIDELD